MKQQKNNILYSIILIFNVMINNFVTKFILEETMDEAAEKLNILYSIILIFNVIIIDFVTKFILEETMDSVHNIH